MTNKLPEVGKRYRLCVGINELENPEYKFCQVQKITNTAVECTVDGLIHYYCKDGFLKGWEELPEIKPEIKRRNRILCRLCFDIIESKHCHDYVTCSCGAVSVDGGLDYFKRNGLRENILELSFPERLMDVLETKLETQSHIPELKPRVNETYIAIAGDAALFKVIAITEQSVVGYLGRGRSIPECCSESHEEPLWDFWNNYHKTPFFETKPETQSHVSELSPEVKEAMEEVRREGVLSGGGVKPFPQTEEGKNILEIFYYFANKSQNLLNALDKQFKVNKIMTKKEYEDAVKDKEKIDELHWGKKKEINKTSESVAAEEEKVNEKEIKKKYEEKFGKFHPLQDYRSCVEQALEWHDSQKKQNLSDKKVCLSEEESIWKPVSELPEDNYSVIIKAKGGYEEIFFGAYREDNQHFMDETMKFVYPKESIDKYCTLTDFINDYEKLKERVKKLEAK